MKDIIIAPSMLSANFSNLEQDFNTIKATDPTAWLHVDVMDGHFVPNITIGPNQVSSIRQCTDLFFDVHLMLTDPIKYIPAFARAGADMITFHVEANDDADECITLIQSFGKKAGIVLSPDTPVTAAEPYLDRVDMVLLMSVYPGFGGQKYIESSTEKIAAMKALIGERNVRLEIDGGINFDTLPLALGAGADTIVAGSGIFKGDIGQNIRKFKTIIALQQEDS